MAYVYIVAIYISFFCVCFLKSVHFINSLGILAYVYNEICVKILVIQFKKVKFYV